jgi:hypothetical protein
VRVWATPERLLGTVTDQGGGIDDPLAGYVPARGQDPRRTGMGLWLARQLCDQLKMARTPYGFTVRLVSAPTAGPGAARAEATSAVIRADTARVRAARARARADEATDRGVRLDAEARERSNAARRPGPVGAVW